MRDITKKPSVILDFKSSGLPEVQQSTSSWKGFKIEYSAIPLPAEYEFKGANESQHYLAYHDLILKDGELQIEGSPAIRGGDLRGKMTYIPKGLAFKGWAAPDTRKNSFTALTFNPELIGEELEILYGQVDVEPYVYFQNESLRSSMLKMENILKSSMSNTSMYMESLGLVTAVEMSMVLEKVGNSKDLRRGGLSQSLKRELEDYIRTNMAKDMTLGELATLAGMSRFHMSRSFKESFGESPVRYINRQRLRFAQALLTDTRLPVGEIALQTGFGSVQHFLKIFRDFYGVTPTEYRKQS